MTEGGSQGATLPVAVFASGSGTNFQALLDREAEGAAYRTELLVTDRPCAAEGRARAAGRAVRRVDFDRSEADASAEADADADADAELAAQLLAALEGAGAQAILLAGFVKLLPAAVCRAYQGRALNIHPALLPSFGGKGMYGVRVHEAVLRAGAKLSGATVHYVSERYDDGEILAQWPVTVRPDDTPDSLAARVLKVEHVLYPEAADALARGIVTGSAPVFRWPGCAAGPGRRAAEAFGQVASTTRKGTPDGQGDLRRLVADSQGDLRRRVADAFGGNVGQC